MRVIVTGAGGFIGQHLMARLAEEHDIEAIGIVRTPSSSLEARSTIEADIAAPGWTRRLPSIADAVVHLAQSRHHRAFPEGASDVYQVNVNATFELLEWSRLAGVGNFVFASTGSVYRAQDRLLTEDDAIFGSSFYAASKIAAEAFCSAYAKQFHTTALRIFGAYGPGASDSVLPRLMRKVANGETITLDGGVGLLTTPTYVADCVDAIVSSLRSNATAESSRVLNVCGDEEVSLHAACTILGELLDVQPRLVANNNAPMRLSGSNARAKQALAWSPRYGLREGLAVLCRDV